MDEKSRHEIILRAKITWAEQATNMTQRAWIDKELREIGMSPLSDNEVKDQYQLAAMPRF